MDGRLVEHIPPVGYDCKKQLLGKKSLPSPTHNSKVIGYSRRDVFKSLLAIVGGFYLLQMVRFIRHEVAGNASHSGKPPLLDLSNQRNARKQGNKNQALKLTVRTRLEDEFPFGVAYLAGASC